MVRTPGDAVHMTAKETTLRELGGMTVGQALNEIRRDLHDLADRAGHIPSYSKDIDQAFVRVAAIERHLGIRGAHAEHGGG